MPTNLGNLNNLKNIMEQEVNKRVTVQLLQVEKACICCPLSTIMIFILVYVELRSIVLIILSILPPLIQIEHEKSIRYPNGYQETKLYFDNNYLITLYMINVVISFFPLCFGFFKYY